MGLPSRFLLQAGNDQGATAAGRSDGHDKRCRAASPSAVIGRLRVLIGVKGQSMLALASRHLNRSTWSQEPEAVGAADRVTSASGAKLTINTT